MTQWRFCHNASRLYSVSTVLNFDTIPDSLLGIWGAVGGTVRHLSTSPDTAGSNRSLFSSSIVCQLEFTSYSPAVDNCFSAGEIHLKWYEVFPLSADKLGYVTRRNDWFTFTLPCWIIPLSHSIQYSFHICYKVRFYRGNIFSIWVQKRLI